jgi:hypothetical protein
VIEDWNDAFKTASPPLEIISEGRELVAPHDCDVQARVGVRVEVFRP